MAQQPCHCCQALQGCINFHVNPCEPSARKSPTGRTKLKTAPVCNLNSSRVFNTTDPPPFCSTLVLRSLKGPFFCIRQTPVIANFADAVPRLIGFTDQSLDYFLRLADTSSSSQSRSSSLSFLIHPPRHQ